MTATARVGSYYAVEPGLEPGKPCYYNDNLGGMGEALSEALHLSGDPGYAARQVVTVTRGRVTRVIRVYEHGKDITDNGVVLIPAAGPPEPAPDQVTHVDFAARRTRKPAGFWRQRPVTSINRPPCGSDSAG